MSYEYIINCLYEASVYHPCYGCHFYISDANEVLNLMYWGYQLWEAIEEVLDYIDQEIRFYERYIERYV